MRPFFLLFLCALLTAGTARAQDATESPEATGEATAETTPEATDDWGFITGLAAENLFPQAMRFSVIVPLIVNDVERVTLTVAPEDGEAETLDIDPRATAVVEEPYTELAVLWNVPRDTPPRLFSEVTYTWTVVNAEGETATAEATTIFQDERVEWSLSEDPNERLNLILPPDVNARRLRDTLQPLVALLFDEAAPPILTLMVYPDSVPPGCRRNIEGNPVAVGPRSGDFTPCTPGLAERIFAATGVLVVQSHSDSPSGVVEAAAEALVDTAYAPVWEGRGVPDWFRVGFADLNAPTPKNELLPLVQNAARTGRLFSLETLITADDDTDSLWHAQAYSLVLYMADRLGIAGVRRFADALAEAPDFATAYEGAMDEPLAALLPGWERWLFTSKAAAAYGFVAFQPDTPTPTLTPTQTLTPTPLPPTATPTATASATVTRTPAPPTETPSITPRPAGSLYTPTPTPQPVAPGIVTDVDPLQVGLIAVLLVILVALIVVYIQLGRRT